MKRIKTPTKLAVFLAFAVFLFVLGYSLYAAFAWDWQLNEVFILWLFSAVLLGFGAATITLNTVYGQVHRYRLKVNQTQEQSLSQIRISLKTELEANLALLQSDEVKVSAENPLDENQRIVIWARSLKTSAFELVGGREDLKYLQPPESLATIAQAYDQINDFNDLLKFWLSRSLLWEEGSGTDADRGMRTIDLRQVTAKQLDEEKEKTVLRINDALLALQEHES